jgi:hypothetical protein
MRNRFVKLMQTKKEHSPHSPYSARKEASISDSDENSDHLTFEEANIDSDESTLLMKVR